jgi:uncharacterized protein YjcR
MTSERHPDSTAPIHAERFLDPRRLARSLYWRGWGVTELVDELNALHGLDLKVPTVASWKGRDKWDEAPQIERAEDCTVSRYCMLVSKETKTGSDYKEIDLLGRQIERMARVRRYLAPGGNEVDLNPNVAARNGGPKKAARKNHLNETQIATLIDAFENDLFDYQLAWRGPKDELLGSSALTTRFILKSRQIGATYYFAREAFIHLLQTGNNQIFISASRAQANNFRAYIIDFVMKVTGVQLQGDPITLDLDGVEGPLGEAPKLYFLGTNYRTAQSYHGDVYVDEVFWVHGFEQIDDVASAMASQKRYRITYFSTPSTIAHQAYRKWSGEAFNEDRPKADRANFRFTDEQLRAGVVGADGIWRQKVSILDAEDGGCDLFDIERLRRRYAPDVFDNLYMCNFVDDSSSMFPFNLMRACGVDSWDAWAKDFDPFALRPYRDGEVLIGYDPAESAAGDDAAMVIVAAPKTPTGKFRVLEKHRMKGLGFAEQAAKIVAQLDRYNVSFIGIDTTGCGASVWQLVVKKFPSAKRIDYSVPVKTQMVLKAKSVMQAKRLEFDQGARDIMASFMAIRAELTKSQRQVTYTASRAGDTGHADLAWAIMHALSSEPLDPTDTTSTKTRVRSLNGRSNDPSADRDRHARRRRDRDQPESIRAGRRSRRPDARVSLRRRGAGPRSPRPDQLCRVFAQRALVRTAATAKGAGPRVSRDGASFVGAPVQARPAREALQALPPARPAQLRGFRAQLPDDGQWFPRAA